MLIDYKGSVSPGKAHVGLRVIPGKKPGDEVILRPGANTISADRWDCIKGHPSVVRMLDLGELVVLSTDDAKSQHDITRGSTPSQALDLVKRTTEVDPLKRWRSQVNKASTPGWENVLKAIDKQIDAVTTDAQGKPAMQRPLSLSAA